jgi:hypothetical protein
MRRRHVSLLAVAGALRAASVDAAPSARLVYLRNPGAETCPDADAIRSAVAARLGYDPFVAYASATMFAEVSKEGASFRARIKLVDENNVVRGTRDLVQEGPACTALIDTMALSMSIAIDPYSLTRGPQPPPPESNATSPSPTANPTPTPTPTPTPSLTPSLTPTPTPSPTPIPPSPSPWHLDAGLGPTAWIGAAPAMSLGGAAFVRPRWNWLSVALEGDVNLPASQDLHPAVVETSLLLGQIVPCAHVGWFGACGLASLGSVHATSRNVTAPRDASAFYAALGLRALVEIPVRASLRVWLGVDGRFPLRVHRLELDGQAVYTLPAVSAGVGAGASVRFF